MSLDLGRNLGGRVSPKEKLLRGAIIAAPIFALPIPPAAIFGVHAALVVFCLLAGIPATFVLAFYGVWLLGVCMDGPGKYGAQLIGDDPVGVPPVYWPFSTYQRRIRFQRRIRDLERACGITDAWPL